MWPFTSKKKADVDKTVRRLFKVPDIAGRPGVVIDPALKTKGAFKLKDWDNIYLQDEKYRGTEVEAHERIHFYMRECVMDEERMTQACTLYWKQATGR